MKVVKPIIIALAVIISIAILSATVIAAITIIKFSGSDDGVSLKDVFSSSKKDLTKIAEEEYENKFKLISVSGNVADVEIKESEDEKIHVLIYGENASYNIDAKKELNIELSAAPCKGICLNKEGAKAEIFVPTEYEHEFNIDYKVGDIDVYTFPKATLKVKVNTGDVEVQNVKTVEIDSNVSDIDIAKSSSIKITNSIGDIDIDKVTDYLNIKNKTGEVEIDNLALTKDSKIENNTGEVKINKVKKVKINAKTKVGESKVKTNFKDAKVKLDITNNVGDISVK